MDQNPANPYSTEIPVSEVEKIHNQLTPPPQPVAPSPVMPPAPSRNHHKLLNFVMLAVIIILASWVAILMLRKPSTSLTQSQAIITPSPVASPTPTLIPDLTNDPNDTLDISLSERFTTRDNKKEIVYYLAGYVTGEGSDYRNRVLILDKTTGKTTDLPLTGRITNAYGPFLTNNENKITYILSTNGVGNFALWSSNYDGSSPVFLTGQKETQPNFTAIQLQDNAIYGSESVDLSPDGKLFVTTRNQSVTGGKSPLWIVNSDGTSSHPLLLPQSFTSASDAKWQADGQHIEFTIVQNGKSQTYVTDLSDTSPTLKN